MFVRSRILNVLAFGCSLAALLCPWYRACGKANGPCNNLAILRVGKSTGFISPALAALVVPGLVAALIDIVFIRWYKRAGLVLHQCYLVAAIASAALLCVVARIVAERGLPPDVELRLQSVGFFLALLGEVLLLMSACCAIASGGDEGRCWFWPTPHPGLPMTMKANHYAFEFDSVLGDLENIDSIASFPSEAKSHCMVSGRSHINIHVDCHGHHTSSPPSASTVPLQLAPDDLRCGGLPLAPDLSGDFGAPSHAPPRMREMDVQARMAPQSLSPSLAPSGRPPALLTMAEITASRPVSLRGLYATAKSSGPTAQRRLDVAKAGWQLSNKRQERLSLGTT